MSKSKIPQDLKRGFETSANAINLIQGMTFLCLIPHGFDGALHFLKERHSDHVVSLTLKTHDIKNVILSYLKTPEKQPFIPQREFLIHDVVELAHIYAEAQHAPDLLLSFHAAFKSLQPFVPHGSLRFIYDTLPSEDNWAIFRMDGLRSKLSANALYIDLEVSVFEEGVRENRANRDINFLARLEDYKRELSEKKYAGVSEVSMELIAKLMQIEPIDFDLDSKELKEIKEWQEGEELEIKEPKEKEEKKELEEAAEIEEPAEAAEPEETAEAEEPAEAEEAEEAAEAEKPAEAGEPKEAPEKEAEKPEGAKEAEKNKKGEESEEKKKKEGEKDKEEAEKSEESYEEAEKPEESDGEAEKPEEKKDAKESEELEKYEGRETEEHQESAKSKEGAEEGEGDGHETTTEKPASEKIKEHLFDKALEAEKEERDVSSESEGRSLRQILLDAFYKRRSGGKS